MRFVAFRPLMNTFFLHSPIKRSIWLNFKCNSSTAEPFGSSYHSFVHFGASTFHLLLCWLLYKIFTVNCILYVNAQAQMVFSAFLFALGSFKLPDFDSVLFYFIVYKWEFCACKKKKQTSKLYSFFFHPDLCFHFRFVVYLLLFFPRRLQLCRTHTPHLNARIFAIEMTFPYIFFSV